MTARTVRIDPDLDLQIDEQGEGRPVIVIHGGGGPATVASITAHVVGDLHARALVPTLPGWNGAPRPDSVTRIEDMAAAFSTWIDQEDLHDVTVIGSSIGGWVAAELAVSDIGVGRITHVVLLDAVGFEVPAHPIRDFFALDARGIAEYTFHDSARFYADPATLPPARIAAQTANMATMRVVAGDPYMADPSLLERVASVDLPVLAIWGNSDRIVTPEYGRAVADAFGDARFALVRDAGHLPHLEQPAAVFGLVDEYLAPRS